MMKFKHSKAHVAFVAKRFHSNLAPLVEAMVDDGYVVTFFSEYIGRSEVHTTVKPVVIGRQKLIFQRSGSAYSFFSFFSLRAFWCITHCQADLFILRDFTIGTILLALLLRSTGRRVVMYSQETVRTERYPFTMRLLHRMCARDIVTPTDSCDQWRNVPVRHRSTWPFAPRWHFLPFIAKCIKAERKVSSSIPPLRILTISKFASRKRAVEWVDLVAKLADEGIIIELHVVGAPLDHVVLEELRERERKLDFLRISVDVPHSEMDAIYASADLFVLPSIDEPASVSQLEAMAHGIPVICSDSNGTACYVANGNTGYVFASNDWEQSLRTHVLRAYCDMRKGVYYTENCLNHVALQFSYDHWRNFLARMLVV